jgi:hypothetical protein
MARSMLVSSANSFRMTAMRKPWSAVRMLRTSVDLPAPRNPAGRCLRQLMAHSFSTHMACAVQVHNATSGADSTTVRRGRKHGAPPVTRVTGTGTLRAALSAALCAGTVTGGFGMASGTSVSSSLELMLAFTGLLLWRVTDGMHGFGRVG